MILSNLGIFGDKKCQNLNIFLESGAGVSCRVLLWWWLLSCPLVRRCAGFRGFRTCHRLALVLWWCAPRLLPAFLLCLWCIALEYGFISRFKGVFSGFWGADVYLYGFGVLRGLWGFCAREVFGGYMACGVFASILSSFVLFLVLFLVLLHLLSLLVLLSSACPLSLPSLSLWVVVSFSLTDYTQKERALRVGASSLVLLWVVGLLCKIWLPVLIKFVIVSLDSFGNTFI